MRRLFPLGPHCNGFLLSVGGGVRMKGFDTKFDTDLTLFIPLLAVACECQTVGPFTCYLKLRYLSCN